MREAFRLLIHERLVVAELNRGAFVRRLSSEDVIDLYRVRQLVEGAALRSFTGTADLEVLRQAVDEGRIAAKEDRWPDVATANMHFHQAVVALAGSARLDEYMRQVSAELRLAFHVMQNPRTFHEPIWAVTARSWNGWRPEMRRPRPNFWSTICRTPNIRSSPATRRPTSHDRSEQRPG